MNPPPPSPEVELRARRIRRLPAAWREEILSACAAEARPAASRSTRRLRDWLWPHPAAWGALAAVWTVLIAVEWSERASRPARSGDDSTMATAPFRPEESPEFAAFLADAGITLRRPVP